MADGLNGGYYDIVGLLVWNFGQAFGMNNSGSSPAKVVMNQPTFDWNTTLLRTPLGDDINGMRAIYGTQTSQRVKWSRRDVSGGWSAATTLPPSYPTTGADGAIGHPAYGNSGYVGLVSMGLGAQGYIVLDKATYPITSSSSWSGYFVYLNYSYPQTNFAPSLAVNTGTSSDAEWFLAWAEKLTTADTCSVYGGNKLWGSNSAYAFSPGYYSTTTYASECTAYAPSVVFHEPSGRFLAFYVRRDFSSTSNNDRIYSRSFNIANGTWGTARPVEIGSPAVPVKSVGPVEAACSPGGACVLTYLSADSNTPRSTMMAFVYDSSQDKAILLWSDDSSFYSQHRPAAAYRDADAEFTYAEAYNGFSSTYWDDYRGYVWSGSDAYIPFVNFSQAVGTYTDHQHAMIEGVDVSWQYILMVQ